MPLSLDNLQTGRKYLMRNYGEEVEFKVLDVRPHGDHKVRHLHTLEVFSISELTRYGKGDDYDLEEIN